MKMIDRTGERYGRLLVIGPFFRVLVGRNSRIFWKCQCDCGATLDVMGLNLISGNTKSCGCVKVDLATTHNMTNSKEYLVWKSMIQRCTNEKNSRWKDYGGRGIKVCERWREFANFYADMGARPSSQHSIDRIENNGNYEPGNCKWSTRSEQQMNKRTSRKYKGVSHVVY